jgi:hypothetical protein
MPPTARTHRQRPTISSSSGPVALDAQAAADATSAAIANRDAFHRGVPTRARRHAAGIDFFTKAFGCSDFRHRIDDRRRSA